MRTALTIAVAVNAALLLVGATHAPAQTLEQRVAGLEKRLDEGRTNLANQLGIEIHGLAAVNYNYNFNTPDSDVNALHVFDSDANSISLDQANIDVRRNAPEGLGFVLDLDFGKTAEVVGGVTRWSSNPDSSESGNSVELRQAYLSYAIAGTPFSIQAGKFVTYHGAEVIKAYDNQNYNISNSILFGFAIPFTHTGLMGTYSFPNELGSLSAGVVNGWDNVSDNNDGKSVHAMLSLTPDPMISFGLSGTYGAEQEDSGRSKRLMITPLITIRPTEEITLIFDYNYGNESNIELVGGSVVTGPGVPGNTMWQGVAAYLVLQANDQLQLALRGEIFDDPDGVRTLFQETGFGPGATFWEVTPTVSYRITEGLTWRAEYRHDESDKRYFGKDSRFIRGQDLVATELLYAF